MARIWVWLVKRQKARPRGISDRKLLQQHVALSRTLQQQGVGQLGGEAPVHGAHLGVAGKEAKGAAAGDFRSETAPATRCAEPYPAATGGRATRRRGACAWRASGCGW